MRLPLVSIFASLMPEAAKTDCQNLSVMTSPKASSRSDWLASRVLVICFTATKQAPPLTFSSAEDAIIRAISLSLPAAGTVVVQPSGTLTIKRPSMSR